MGAILAIPAAFLAGGITQVAAAAGASLAAQAAISSIATALGTIAIATGLSFLLGALFKPEVPEPSDGQVETQQQIPPRHFVYGRVEISGPLAFKKVQESTSKLHKIILLHDGELPDAYAIETIKMDDKICTLDESGTNYITNAFIQDATKRVQVFFYYGADDQAADPTLVANFPGVWTEDHCLRGIAYAFVLCWGASAEDFIGAYPNGEPVLKVVLRGRAVWDPRDTNQHPNYPATWIWSDNPALCILDWISMHPKGYQIDRSRLDIDSFEAFANVCDELVPLNTGGSEKRYRVAMKVTLDTPRTDVLGRLRDSCDAHIYKTGSGLWAIRGGKWEAPTETLDSTAGHIIEAEMRDGVDALTRYNELALRFLSPDHGYVETDAWPYQRTADSEFVAGIVRTKSISLSQVPSQTQAHRLAKIYASYDNPDWIGSVRTNFYGLHLIGSRVATLNWAEPGETLNDTFWLESDMNMLENGTGMQIRVRSAESSSYSWDETTEEPDPIKPLPPEDVDYTEGTPPANVDNFTGFGGSPGNMAFLTWNIPADNTWYIGRVWRALDGAGFANAVEVSGPRYRPKEWPAGDANGDPMEYFDPVSAGDYDYYITSENAVGDRNATPVGPVSVTVT